MCRFNLILIKDESVEELLKQEGYQKFYDDLYGNQAYQLGYCNCDSFVGSLIDRKGMKYSDAIAISKKEMLEHLYQIENIMNQPGYEERKEQFLQIRMKHTNELDAFTEHITDYEMKQTDLIQKEYSGEELNNRMGELYKEISNMFTSLENQPDYKKKKESYADILRENQLLEESTCYFLTKKEENDLYSRSIPLSEILSLEYNLQLKDNLKSGAVEMIELPDQSRVIGEVIASAEEINTDTKNIDEYNSYYELFSELLKYVTSFIFCTIWSEPKELKNVKTVGIESLIIDDLAFLDYDEMISITK